MDPVHASPAVTVNQCTMQHVVHMEHQYGACKKEGAFRPEVFLSNCSVRQKRESAFQA